MKHPSLWCVSLTLMLLTTHANAQDAPDELSQIKQNNTELRAELIELKSAYEALQAEAATLRAELALLKRSNEDLQVQTRELTELAGLTPSGDRVESVSARFTTDYDEDAGQTTVRSGVEAVKIAQGSAADHRLSLAYVYDGREMQTPPDTVTVFIQAIYSGGVYRDQPAAEFEIDGETVDVPIAEYQATPRRVNVAGKRSMRKDDETLILKIDRDLLRRLSRAIQVNISVGTVRMELTRDQAALFRAVQKRIELGA